MQVTTQSPTGELVELVKLKRSLPPPSMRRALRITAGLSAAELAAALRVTRQTVSKWERGLRTPRGLHLRNYVAALDELRITDAPGDRSGSESTS